VWGGVVGSLIGTSGVEGKRNSILRRAGGHLVVKRQEVVAGRFESGHGCDASYALVRAVPVVVMYPSIELVGTLVRVLIDEAIGPLAQCRLDEALGLAVGLRTVGSGEAMFDLQFGASLSEEFGTKRIAVIGQQSLDW